MMSRTPVSLPPDVDRRAKARAAARGISFAEYVRTLIEHDLGEERPRADVSRIFDLGRSDRPDIARLKDTYLGEAIAAAYERERDRGS